MERPLRILLFYKYVEIVDLDAFRRELLEACNKIGLRGRILVAHEGINGSVSGTKEQTEEFKKQMRADERFEDVMFKEDEGVMHPFKKMVIKVKEEILNFGQKVDLKNTGKYLSPKEFLDLYENELDIVILDARNNYESRVGKFKNAVTPDIQTFREFPKVVEKLADKKDKKIVMYCTGGIRCEKASAYMKEKGFKDVSQLHGGILTFGKEFPDTIWEGTCFVFDKRMTSAINGQSKPISQCDLCSVDCDLYRNCARKECDERCVVCLKCEQDFGGCCSKKCFLEIQREANAPIVS